MKTLIILIIALVTGAVLAENPEERAQLHQNVHNMRIRMEQADAEAAAKARSALIGLYAGGSEGGVAGGSAAAGYSSDVLSISQMRQEINQSFERTENMFPCLGANIDVQEGQAILICGDNSGLVRNENTETDDDVNINLPGYSSEEVTP